MYKNVGIQDFRAGLIAGRQKMGALLAASLLMSALWG